MSVVAGGRRVSCPNEAIERGAFVRVVGGPPSPPPPPPPVSVAREGGEWWPTVALVVAFALGLVLGGVVL